MRKISDFTVEAILKRKGYRAGGIIDLLQDEALYF